MIEIVGTDRVVAEFDPEPGFPVRLFVDSQESVPGQEIDYRVEELTPLVPP